MKIYRFRNCLLNTAERAVIKEDECVGLTTKTFDVLQFLIENSGRVVTKDELLGEVWNGNFVEESNLPVHVSKLRRSLGETRNSRFIETVQGVGYRFIAPVHEVAPHEWSLAIDRAMNGDQAASRPAEFEGNHPSLAVLPFLNKTGDSSLDYVVDGVTESITSQLGLTPNLKVIARSTTLRYRQNDIDARSVGETLDISAVLVGEVSMADGEFVVLAELVRVADGSTVWRTELRQPPSLLIKTVNAITSGVAAFVHDRRDQRTYATYLGTKNADSYRDYLRGKYFTDKRTVEMIQRGIEYFDRSVKKDPQNIYSYIALIDSHRLLYALDQHSYGEALPVINEYLLNLSEFDQNVADLQLAYGEIRLQMHWDIKGAEGHIRRAIELNPNLVSGYYRLVEVLSISQRLGETDGLIRKILELDPLSLLTYKRVGRSFYCLGRFDDSLEFLADALELEPADYEALALLGAVLIEVDRLEEALDVFERSMASNPTPEVLSMLGQVEALMGNHSSALDRIRELQSRHNATENHPLMLARIYTALGNKDMAFDLLNRSFEKHEIDVYGIPHDWRWKLLRDDERFTQLVERIYGPK